MTLEELEKMVKKHECTLERHEFMNKSLSDLSGQIFRVVDEQNRLLSEINIKIQEGFSEVQQCLASHDAQIKMLQNTIRIEAGRSAQRDYDIEQRMNRRFAESKLRFDALEDRLDGHDKRFDVIDKRFDEHDKRFDAHDKRFDAHDKRFDAIDERLDGHDKRFDAHDKRFDAHDKRFDDHDKRFDAHDKRFDDHDKRFDEHDKRFDRIDNELAELKQLIIERLPKV